MTREPEQIELLLSQLGEDTLTAAERSAVEAALAADPALRDLAAQYGRLDAAIARIRATRLTLDAAALASRIGDALLDDLEYRVSERLDGDLPTDEARRLAAAVASSLELRSRESALSRTHEIIEQYAAAGPQINLSALSERIRRAVRREAVRSVATRRVPRWAAWGTPIAVAASLLIVAMLSRRSGPTPAPIGPNAPANPSLLDSGIVIHWDVPDSTARIKVVYEGTESLEIAQPNGAPGKQGIVSGGPAAAPVRRAESNGLLYLR